jgi:hypothetical protein
MNIKKGSTLERLHWWRNILVLPGCYIVLLCLVTFPNTTPAQAKQEGRGVSVKPRASEQKVALVIGNADYDTSVGKLKNPANDATDMATALTRLGFKLVNGKANLNVNRRQMVDLIRDFGSQISSGGVGVFYFAGHGVQIDKHNYLIPITDSLRFQEDAEFEAVDVDQILRQMEYAENALNILILDACRNNELPKKSRDARNGLGEPQRKPSGIYIAFAARDGQTASENPNGRNGLYTQELLKNLEEPDLRIEDIFITTRREVKRLSRLSGQVQEPIEYGSLDYIFYFKHGETAGAQPPLSPLPSATLLIPFRKGDKFGFSDVNRKLVIEAKYDFVDIFQEGLAWVRLNDKHGYIDKTGKEVIPLKYNIVGRFSQGLADVGLNGKYGFIDKMGKEVIPLKYDGNRYSVSFSDGLASMMLNSKWGYIDKTGKEVIPFKYDTASPFSEGLAGVELNGKFGFIDKMGKEVIPLKYDGKIFGSSFSDGMAQVKLNGKFGFIDKTGKEVIPFKYDSAFPFSDGLAEVELNGRQGYIDKTGKEVIPFKYDRIIFSGSFSEGLAGVQRNGKQGYIDKTGKEVIPLKYDTTYSFSGGLALVQIKDEAFYVDKNGTEYYEP